jgi:hypothetical protein
MQDNGYFDKRRQELGLDRYDTLQKVQVWLEKNYPGQVRAVSLNRGVLRLSTSSAALATDLRFKQMYLLELAGGDEVAKRLQVQINSR